MPWLSYTNGCSISNDCSKLTELIVWDMENTDPCIDEINKPSLYNGSVDVSTSASGSDVQYARGKGDSKFAIAIANGQTVRFKSIFKPDVGQSGAIQNLVFDIKSITNPAELYCDETEALTKDLDVSYSITILSQGRQMYMGLKTANADWDQEIIDIDYISAEGENLFETNAELELEILISNFTTDGKAVLGLDNVIIEGKECLFDNSLKYEWSTGDTTERLYSVERGDYCVTVTDCNGCQAIDCISVN